MADTTATGRAGTGQQKHQFSTFGGVFTPSILTILGAIMFMRGGFVTGQAGILQAVLILLISKLITYLTALSISAIATNMRVRGGGAYFLISRVLGAESGGAIGIVLYFAQALSVPFYVLGFTEALVLALPVLKPYFLFIALGSALFLFFVAYVGANWSIRLQFVILAVLVCSIASFLIGLVMKFNPELFAANWGPGYQLIPVSEGGTGENYDFWRVFAIYFPAVTGILAGINMSGDLRDPARSIPKGTLLAITIGMLVYFVQILVSGGAYPREDLITRPFETLKDAAALFNGLLVVLGVTLATLSSALGSYLGAPRIMQAVARDRLLKPLSNFAKGSAHGDEPRRALVLTGIITVAVIAWAAQQPEGGGFNAVAGLITMFFLYTYGILNLAAFIEATGKNPSFRPRFRFFHRYTALAGALACGGAAFLINWKFAAVAVAIILGLYYYMRTRQLSTAFGDARRGFIYMTVRNNLLRLRDMESDTKNWRPNILVFSGNPKNRALLVNFAVWLESGRGIVYLVNILKGKVDETCIYHETALKQLRSFCREHGIQAFSIVMMAENLAKGISAVLQTASTGPIRPNLAMFGWRGKGGGELIRHLAIANCLGMSLIVLRAPGYPQHYRRIDIYWRGRGNGDLLLLLAHLLQCSLEWARASIRLIRVVEREEGRIPARKSLRELIENARVDATAHVKVSTEPFAQVLREESEDASCIFLGFNLPGEDAAPAWENTWDSILEGLPPTFLVHHTSDEEFMEQ